MKAFAPRRRAAAPAALLAAALLAAATAAAADFTLLDDATPQGRVRVVFSTDADVLSLERDLTATLTATAPDGAAAPSLPSVEELRARFEGFSVADGYSRPAAAGASSGEIRWRLRADPAAPRYRLAPFAVRNGGASFATAPLLFPLASLPEAEGEIEISPRRFFVWPSPRQILRGGGLLLAALVLAAALLAAARRIHRAVRVRMMSPSQRALHELSALLGRGLPERGLFKDYYVELTHVVRRYIERAYGIRAPRQTTEEFLASAGGDPRFAPGSVEQLSGFLGAADMVKFAGVEATIPMAGEAAAAARRYIEGDAAIRAD